MTEKQLIFHESGHLILNSLVRKLNLVSSNGLKFQRPIEISVNLNEGSGEVVQAGFPIYNWSVPYVLEQNPHPQLKRNDFYSKNIDFLVSNCLIQISGFVVESFFLRNDRLENEYAFANDEAPGEKIDKQQFTSLIGFYLSDQFDSVLSIEFLEEVDRYILFFKNEIVKLCYSEELIEALKMIESKFDMLEFDAMNLKFIKGDEFDLLLDKLDATWEDLSIENIIDEFLIY